MVNICFKLFLTTLNFIANSLIDQSLLWMLWIDQDYQIWTAGTPLELSCDHVTLRNFIISYYG